MFSIFNLISSIILLLLGWYFLFKYYSTRRNTGSVTGDLFNDDLKVASLGHIRNNYLYKVASEKRGTKLALMSVELDGLKEIIATLPTDIKKPLVREIINRIKFNLNSTDIVAKTEMNDFVLLVHENHHADIEVLVTRLVTSLQQKYYIHGSEYTLDAYIGISTYPEHSTDFDVLYNNAITARFAVHKEGLKNYSFSTQMKNSLTQEDILLKDMEMSIENNDFELYYQPQYDIKKNKIIGVEALIRWNHPTKGMIYPNEFIPLAETSGMIIPLGYWILEESCSQYINWGCPDIVMSVNLSGYQFGQQDLLENIKTIIDKTGIPPHNLNLEITETTTMKDIDYTVSVLKQLRELGVLVSVDDFGTGFSSLAYLKNFPVTHLKIDRSFVVATDTGQTGEIVIRNIINLSQELNLKVIAEGVETVAQYNLLKKLGCDEIQGYLITPPKPAKEVELKYILSNYVINLE